MVLSPVVEQSGDHAVLADALLGLVLAGTRRATAGPVADFAHRGEPLPRIGGHWVACDSAGRPAEGENDRTRVSWLPGHLAYFTRTQQARGEAWSDELEVVFER